MTKIPLVVRLLGAIVIGAILGAVLHERATILGEIGVLVVKLLKALATPLVFFAVLDSFCRAKIPAKKGAMLLGICVMNAAVAGALAIGISALISPGTKTNVAALSAAMAGKGEAPPKADFKLDPLASLKDLIPESVPDPFLRNNVLAIVLLAILAGVALRRMRSQGKGEKLVGLVEDAFHLLANVLHYVIEIVPLAVLGVVAKVVGTTGFAVVGSLGALVATVTIGLLLHVFGWYAFLVFAVARRSPVLFFRAAWRAIATALGTGSSMATLPVTLETLEKQLKVSRGSARLAACVGTNFNNDGIMLYEVVAALFVAQISGIELDTGQKVQLALTSALAAAGIAGVPEAGLITLSLVLSSVGLPLASLPLLLTVDWLLGRLRAATNVTSDLLVATLLDRLGGPTAEDDEGPLEGPVINSESGPA